MKNVVRLFRHRILLASNSKHANIMPDIEKTLKSKAVVNPDSIVPFDVQDQIKKMLKPLSTNKSGALSIIPLRDIFVMERGLEALKAFENNRSIE